MTTDDRSPEEVEAAARVVLEQQTDERVRAARALAAARAGEDLQRTELQMAERATAAAYAEAERAGWTRQMLRDLGIRDPARRAPGRPRGPRTARSKSSPGSGEESDQT